MFLEPSAISAAFAQYIQRYGVRKDWDISHRCQCWAKGQHAFDCDCAESFDWLHRALRGYWQAFRNAAGPCWSAAEAFGQMKRLDQVYRGKRLSQCGPGDIPALWQVVLAMSPIKPMKSGPSVVAISKFLHFWNPRLFVIVDYEMVWRRVISSHWWLWREVVAARQVVEAALPGQRGDPTDATCDLVSYLAILLWAGQIVRDNPTVPAIFAQHCRDAPSEFALPFLEYEAAGLEWLLLGLAELPPPGVRVSLA
jgi:hypothetical protein